MKRINKIRNIGIIAHVDAGKTTLTERILYYTGLTYKLGNVDDGNTVMDTDPQESKRGITIQSAAITTQWLYPNTFGQANERAEAYQINIIDTPGHIDFTAEVERSLRVLDGAVAIFCAKSGVEPQSETVWRQADKYDVPRIAFVNKLDRDGADFFRVVKEMETHLGVHAVPLQMPYGEGKEFQGVIDLLTGKLLLWNEADQGMTWEAVGIPAEMEESVAQWQAYLVEQVATTKETFLEAYLNGESFTEDELIEGIRLATLSGAFLPVLCGAAYKNKGVQPLLDAVVRYMPTPTNRKAVEGQLVDEEGVIELTATETAPFSALVFKVMADPYVGKMALARVYSGRIEAGTSLMNARLGEKTRVSRIMRVLSNKFESQRFAEAGEIYALIGAKNVRTGDTLSPIEQAFNLESIEFPEPVIGYAIEAKRNQDSKALGMALAKLQDEDPTLKVVYDPNTGQTVLRGMGELHLEVTLTKLAEQYEVEVLQGMPQVAYQEALTATVIHRQVFKKQNSGSGQFADISVEIGPRTDGEDGLLFIDEIKGGVIPKEFIPSVRKGFELSMETGQLAGYPLRSMRVRLFDGSIHQVDSHAADFETVAKEAFKAVYLQCKPTLLEPIMTVHVQAPEDYTGGVTGDLNRRSGLMKSIELKGNVQQIVAEVPLRNLFGYIMDLRGLSAGRGSASLSFAHYKQVNKHFAMEILETV